MGWVVTGVQVRINDGDWTDCQRLWTDGDPRASRKWLVSVGANLTRELGDAVTVTIADDRGEMTGDGYVTDVTYSDETGWASDIEGEKALKPVGVSDAKR